MQIFAVIPQRLDTGASPTFAGLTLSDDLVMGGNDVQNANIYVAASLFHYGDVDTKIAFGSDTYYFEAGGIQFLKFIEQDKNDDESVFNEDGGDINERFEAVGQTHALFVQGSDGKVGVGNTALWETLWAAFSAPSFNIVCNENQAVCNGNQIVTN